MSYKANKNKKITVELNDFLNQNRKIFLEQGMSDINCKCVCQQELGIWSKKNGIEWGRDLKWSYHSNVAGERDSMYGFAISLKHSLKLEIEDFVHANQKVFLRKLTLHNESKEMQDLKLFFQQDFKQSNGTSFFNLSDRTLYYENQGRYLLFNGILGNEGIAQYTTCQKNNFNHSSLLDTNNGSLSFSPISAGRIKSAFSLETTILPYEIRHGYYWMVIGDDLLEVSTLNQAIKKNPDWLVKEFIENNINYNDKIIPISK